MNARAIRGLNWTGLRRVQVRGTLPSDGWVRSANHHSWWDGWAGATVIRDVHRRPGLQRVYDVGSSTHPGARAPMVMLAARLVTERITGDHPPVAVAERLDA